MHRMLIKIVLIILILNIGIDVFSQNKKIDKTYSWNFSMDSQPEININNYDCDIEIFTNTGKETRFELTVLLELDDSKDLSKVDEAINELSCKKDGNSVVFKTKFWDSKDVSIKIFGFGGSKKLSIPDVGEFSYDEIKISAKVYIPEDAYLKLGSKYSKITLEDIKNLELKSYTDKLYANSIEDKLIVNAKYSTLNFKNLGSSDIVLYSGKFFSEDVGDMKISSKYSKYLIKKAGDLDIESYSDKFEFADIKALKINSKYSKFHSSNATGVSVTCFDSNFDMGRIAKLDVLSSKYSQFRFISTKDISVKSSFDDSFKSQKCDLLDISSSKYSVFSMDDILELKLLSSFDDKYKFIKCSTIDVKKSKYSSYTVEMLNSSLFLDGFDNRCDIENTTQKLSGIVVKGKYQKINLNILKTVGIDLIFKGKYGNCNYDSDLFDIKKEIKKSVKIDLVATQKGGNPNAKIEINGFDNRLDLDLK